MNLFDLIGQSVDPVLRLGELIEQYLYQQTGGLRQGIQLICQLRNALRTLRRHDPELGHVGPDRIARLGNLSDEEVARPAQNERRGVHFALHRDKPHRWSRHRLADRFGIGRISLAAFDVRLHVGRWHQPHLMAHFLQPPPPVMRPGAGLHANQTAGAAFEKERNWFRRSWRRNTALPSASTPWT